MLLFVLFFNISGQFLTFKASQYSIRREIKKEIKNQVPENELVKISFTLSELCTIKWEETGKEFWYKGNIYDVVKKITCGDIINFYCINDRQEKMLFANLEILINRQMNSEKQGNGFSLKKFQTDYFFSHQTLQFSSLSLCFLTSNLQHKLLKGFFSESPHPPEEA